MKIYTKFGDSGDTSLYGGARVRKDSARIETLGAIDELNAYLGYAHALIDDTEVTRLLNRIQNYLFALGADLATPASHTKAAELRISKHFTTEMEEAIDKLSVELPPLTHFILPGGCTGGAVLHIARAICRRSERGIVKLADKEVINPELLRSINRLSDVLFILARTVNNRENADEEIWKAENFV